MTEQIIIGIIAILGSYFITVVTNKANQKKQNAEIDQIYARLGLDKKKNEAENANTWMDVARKAAEEYERVMRENVNLKKQVNAMSKRISLLQNRIRSLETNKTKRNK